MPAVQLSVHLVNFAQESTDWSRSIDTAVMLDDSGIDRLAVSDHVVFGEELDAYGRPELGGAKGGKQPTGPDGHWLEPLTLLSVIAGRTKHIRLSTSILIAALRTPAVLAKQLSTLDVLSGGRVDLGVGIGWQREEYEACGLDFHRRGDLLDRCLAVCRELWTQPVAAFDDGELRFERIHQMPKPVSPDGIPIWVSGRINRRTVDRMVRFGTGWIPWGDHIADPGPGIAELRRALEDAGRDPSDLEAQSRLVVVTGDDGEVDVDATFAAADDLVGAGVTDLRLQHRWGADLARESEVAAALVEAARQRFGA